MFFELLPKTAISVPSLDKVSIFPRKFFFLLQLYKHEYVNFLTQKAEVKLKITRNVKIDCIIIIIIIIII